MRGLDSWQNDADILICHVDQEPVGRGVCLPRALASYDACRLNATRNSMRIGSNGAKWLIL